MTSDGSSGAGQNAFFLVYRRLFDPPGAAAFVSAGFVARLTVSMASLGLVLALTANAERGYAAAGMVVAAFGLASALISPYVGRQIDYHGQRAVLLPLVTVFTISMVAVTAAVAGQASSWLLLPLAVVSGASMPVCGPLVRTRWAKIYGGSRMLRVSYAFEGVTDEVVYIVGPVAVAIIATSFGSSPSLLVVAACAAVGTIALALQTRTQPEPMRFREPRRTSTTALMGNLPLKVICTALFGIGGALGSLEIITVAYAELQHDKGLSGLLLGLMGVASMIAGLVFGAVHMEIGPVSQLGATIFAFGGALVLLTFVDGLGVLAVLLACAGLFLAPAMITCMELVQRAVPQSALTEAMTWASAGIGLGLTAGSLLGGILIDSWSPAAAWRLPAGFVLAAALVVAVTMRPMSRDMRE